VLTIMLLHEKVSANLCYCYIIFIWIQFFGNLDIYELCCWIKFIVELAFTWTYSSKDKSTHI
jgi:hypothetical protein